MLNLASLTYAHNIATSPKSHIVASNLLSIPFFFNPNFFRQLAHFHARRCYANVASAFSLTHHYRAVLAWGS